ncbi:glycosyltransferase [Candidatus Nitrotoga sp. 1052]|uniref:glycosyltransferase n=1 Tax=Candidatus Nitrotoga sp. 1052 TaxID=2886964 RepID=UPI001EF4A9D8|nr:glycosyltransferase [Candidatus Nitrotoga sp. 1052]CAH1090699.1 SEC-C motif-containing protein [Candidatus Nitrotoga sp. 1052]
MNIKPVLSDEVCRALAGLGRTEDVKFSPDGRRLAIAGFNCNKILILEVDFDFTDIHKNVVISDFVEISSLSLKNPHGLAFLDDKTLIVANRKGGASVLKLPPRGAVNKIVELPELGVIPSNLWLYSPGSVSAISLKNGLYDVLICNNYAHYVSRHILDMTESLTVKHNEILLAKGLDIPDGVSFSNDGRWIAVSNHGKHCVFLYENTPELTQDSEPSGILHGASFPHGVRFIAEDRFILVADAGAPFVHIYEKSGDCWAGRFDPVNSFRVMNDGVFKLGRNNLQEGGPKGIDVNEDMNVLVTTCEHQPLAFFDLHEALKRRRGVESCQTSVPPRRLQACPCGSGKRYKHCCGEVDTLPKPIASSSFRSIMESALAAQRANELESAERLYLEALELRGDDPDALHMLGVVLYCRHRVREASGLIRRAGMATQWQLPGILFNYGLALGSRMLGRDTARGAKLRQEYDCWFVTRPYRSGYEPLVSVVIPSYNHASYIERSLESVYAQTYRNLELIIIDDASSDGSPDIIREKLRSCHLPHRFVARGTNLGAHATLNEAIALAQGEFINPLNSDDLFEPGRIAEMVEKVARSEFEWGFSKCICMDPRNQVITPLKNNRAYILSRIEESLSSSDTIGSALLGALNPTVSTGNLFFSKSLYKKLGGFRDYQSNHDWDFCLRALWYAEPRLVSSNLYRYRLHENNTIRKSLQRNREEYGRLFADYHDKAITSLPDNEFAPAKATAGSAYLAKVLAAGQISLPQKTLTDLDDELTRQEDDSLLKSDIGVGEGLNLVGYFRGESGLAESVRTMAATCHAKDIQVNIQDAGVIMEGRQSNRSMDRFLTSDNDQRTTLFYMNPDQLESVWRRYFERGDLRERRVISYWHWEIDKFPKKWQPALELVDEIWVASEFVEQLVKRVTDKPVVRIPHAIDVKISRPYSRTEFALPDDRFLFLFNFDFYSFADRKNPWATIEAFRRAFPIFEDSVGLVIKCHHGERHLEKFILLQKLAEQDPRITILDCLLSREEMYGLQSVCDAYVSLHRSEGFGLGMAECMALGKPVIGTGYSGNLEFMDSENSCLVNHTLIPVKPGQFIYYEPGWMWADPDVDHAAEYMIRLFEDPDYRQRISARAAADMSARYNHQIVGKIIKDRLDHLNKR